MKTTVAVILLLLSTALRADNIFIENMRAHYVALAAVQAMIAPVDMAPHSDAQCNARTANHFIDEEMTA